MKSVFFTLPLLVAAASARAVANADAAANCKAEMARCVQTAVDTGSPRGLQCLVLQDACTSHLKARATPEEATPAAPAAPAAPTPITPPSQEEVDRISNGVRRVIGNNTRVDIDKMVKTAVDKLTAKGYDVNKMVAAVNGTNGGFDLEKTMNRMVAMYKARASKS
ncbi:hypothetical protein LOY97_006586, partial [Ophidiomyces ophidiicola]